MAKIKIIINSAENIRDILQETYKLSDEQLTQSQNEITKLANATRLQDCTMGEKEQYAKAVNNYLTIKDKAISKKIEVAKLLTEIYKHNGDINSTINDTAATKNLSFDFSKIREIVNNGGEDKNKTQTIELKNR